MSKTVKYMIIFVAVTAVAYAAYTLWQKKQKNAPVTLRQSSTDSPEEKKMGVYDDGLDPFRNPAY